MPQFLLIAITSNEHFESVSRDSLLTPVRITYEEEYTHKFMFQDPLDIQIEGLHRAIHRDVMRVVVISLGCTEITFLFHPRQNLQTRQGLQK